MDIFDQRLQAGMALAATRAALQTQAAEKEKMRCLMREWDLKTKRVLGHAHQRIFGLQRELTAARKENARLRRIVRAVRAAVDDAQGPQEAPATTDEHPPSADVAVADTRPLPPPFPLVTGTLDDAVRVSEQGLPPEGAEEADGTHAAKRRRCQGVVVALSGADPDEGENEFVVEEVEEEKAAATPASALVALPKRRMTCSVCLGAGLREQAVGHTKRSHCCPFRHASSVAVVAGCAQ